MTIGLRILLIALSGLLTARDLGTATLAVQIEIAEETATTQKEILIIQQQAAIKKTSHPVTILTYFIPFESTESTTFKVFQTTEPLWLQHRVLLI